VHPGGTFSVVLYSILSETASEHPDDLAAICGDDSFTYSQLKERVDRLTSGLKGLGIRHSDRIAVIHRNCHRYLEAYFAAAKLGAILVPMNYRLLSKDYYYMINNSLTHTVIAQPEFISWVYENNLEIPLIKYIILTETDDKNCPANEGMMDYEEFLTKASPQKIDHSSIMDIEMSQIYYTSGTTGMPKGVILTHKNNMVHSEGCIEELEMSPKDRWLHVAPMFHLADAWAVWAVTMAGGVHVFIPAFDPESVLRTIEEHKITLSNFIPSMLNMLVNNPDVKSYDLSSMRLVMSGGAPIAKEVVRKVIDTFGCDYIQTYGLTETSPFLTMSILSEEMKKLPFEERLRYMVTTGRPFYNVKLRVVRQDGSEVALNNEDVGEILVKGDTITPGYWHQPDETSTRIVDGWLHTRDLAVVNPEGYVTIVDRMDDLIITGGENVYSIEVEDVLYSHPKVLEATVIGLPHPVWGEMVTAVVVPKNNHELTEEELIEFCKNNLASFKVPKKVFFTGELPKTGSAKVYKYKLREQYGDHESGA
jgi:acyl-CoA synthetase (AMP-forming)/AMP-acid ligase II